MSTAQNQDLNPVGSPLWSNIGGETNRNENMNVNVAANDVPQDLEPFIISSNNPDVWSSFAVNNCSDDIFINRISPSASTGSSGSLARSTTTTTLEKGKTGTRGMPLQRDSRQNSIDIRCRSTPFAYPPITNSASNHAFCPSNATSPNLIQVEPWSYSYAFRTLAIAVIAILM